MPPPVVDAGAKTIEINTEPTSATRFCHIHLHGRCGQILPRLVG